MNKFFSISKTADEKVKISADLFRHEAERGEVSRVFGRGEVIEFAMALMTTVDATRGEMTQEIIRQTVREEMSKLLDAVGKKVGVPEYMEAEKMEDAFVSIIETAAEKSANTKVYDHEEYYHSQS